ncbi:FadR/GntR family transcriptional regulator [Sporichthya polymorpha]|uniref:FadR/GntR family transcriptional regulator n=1 Tax=Sporichthya polymorpha TaxID=35751 RepID=UPI00037CED25|nr:GntR family transcriptional regulator [Sporichthya polymorpha]
MRRTAYDQNGGQAANTWTATQVRAPKTAELIALALRREIVRGDLKRGETLPPELQLMGQFGVSRPTLREAFRILETEGLIVVRRGSRGGAEVTCPDVSVAARYVGILLQMQGTTIQDVYQARMITEPAAAAMAARNRTRDDLKELHACVDKLADLVEASERTDVPTDPTVWAEVTFRFHDLLLRASRSKTLALQGAVLQDIVATHVTITITRGFSETKQSDLFLPTLRSYRKMLRLLEAKDDRGAEEHWRAHMEIAGRHLLGGDLRNKRVVELFG